MYIPELGDGSPEIVCFLQCFWLTSDSLYSLLRGHVTAGAESVGWWSTVDVKRRLYSHAELYDRTRDEAHRTPSRDLVLLLSPVVMPLHVAALEVHIRLMLLCRVRRSFSGYHERIQSDRALGPTRVYSVDQFFEVVLCLSTRTRRL